VSAECIDLVIIGAGPAGMAAACEARQHGMNVAVLDEQPAAGGQIYRGVATAHAQRRAVLGADYAAGLQLVQEFEACGARHISGATVWNVSRDMTVNFIHEGRNQVLWAHNIILASGAMERPFPIPGWTLPGVMGAGAAQILLKTAGALPRDPVVLAGCGPLLYLLASQYLNAGVRIRALIHTVQGSDYVRAGLHLPRALGGRDDLVKGIRMVRQLRRHRVPVYAGARALSVQGTDHAQAIVFTHRGKPQKIETPLVLLHQGVVPNTQLSWSLDFPHDWNAVRACWEPRTDRYGQLEDSGIYVVGDSRAIVGAQASAAQGRLAAIAIARTLSRQFGAQLVEREATVHRALRRALAIRPLLDALYRPVQRIPQDDSVIVCRCEEVTAGQIRQYVDIGCQGPNQTKAFGRCGMGPCQGRFCGLTVTELIAQARGVDPAQVGHYRIRAPIKPVTLGELVGEVAGSTYRSALSLSK